MKVVRVERVAGVSRRFHLFVSAGPDLEDERELIGRMIAELPVQLGWEIKRTPLPGQPQPADLESVRRCDLFLLLMGEDIVAPVGMELDMAQRSRRAIVPLLRKGRTTPAAAAFLRAARLEWQTFTTAEEAAKLARVALIDALIEHVAEFELPPHEWQALEELRRADVGEAPPPAAGGAGGGGIILGPEDAAAGGVLVSG
jgi:hypothetical protein